MVWRYTAKKGNYVIRGGSAKKELIQRRAKSLRRAGYKVRVYKTKGSK